MREPWITEPGVYPEVTHDEYHADPVAGGSLSSTGARALLPPSCPARFRYQQLHGRPPTKAFDTGHAAHQLVLGHGPGLEVLDFPDFRTKAAREARAEARAAGRVPLKQDAYDQVVEMADAIRAHPLASALLDPAGGNPERTIVWRDEATGVMLRARLDWLPHRAETGNRELVTDYKTCASADQDALSKAMGNHGYHLQAAQYLEGAQAVGAVGPDARFVFIAQEKEPPYIVTVFEPDAKAMAIGHSRNRWARQVYARCMESDEWPGYELGVAHLSLPPWVEIEQGGDL